MSERDEYELRLKIKLGLERVSEKLIARVRNDGVELVCGDAEGNIIHVHAANITKIITSRSLRE